MIKSKLLPLAIILQIICSDLAFASISSGANVEFIPAAKNLGIGILQPTTNLDINGQIMIRNGSPGAGKVLSSDANGKASWINLVTNNAPTLDSLDSLQFLRSDTTDNFSSGVLSTDSGTRFDINGDLSIADTNISLDGANTTFTQTTGNISFNPASGKDLTSTISSGGEFKINTNGLVFNGTNSRTGVGFVNPTTKLDVNGTILASVINGTSANFTNLTFSSISNSGSNTFNKVIVSNNVNGATANFTNANFGNLILSGTVNGSSTSFDGDFSNGSVLFSNNNGVVSQDNSHLYWDSSNKRLAINHNQPDMALDVNGAMVIRNISDAVITSPGSPLAFITDHAGYPNWGSDPTATTVTVNTGATSDNTLLIAIEYGMGKSATPITETYNTPVGWTLIKTERKDMYSAPDYKRSMISAWYKIASSEPTSYTFTSSNTASTPSYKLVRILKYSGADLTNPINAIASINGEALADIINTAAVTTTVANTTIIKATAVDDIMCGSSWVPAGYMPTGYTQRATNVYGDNTRVVDKDQAAIGITDTNPFDATGCSLRTDKAYVGITLALAPNPGSSTSMIPDPDNGSSFLYLSNGASATANPGDIFAKIKENGTTKTIRIVDFNNGSLASSPDASSIDGIDSTSLLRSDASSTYSAGTLTFDTGTTLNLNSGSTVDINSTNVSIADTNITLDGANTSFTQSSGNISINPASGKDFSTSLSGAGSFKINTSDLVYSNSKLGIGTANPATKLDVNGTIKGLNINGTTANFPTINTSSLIATGSVNGITANFNDANINNTNLSKLISSGVVNGTTANFTNASMSSLNLASASLTTLTSSTINNSATISAGKLISSGSVNGTTANLQKLLTSGSVNGSNANFNNFIVSGIFNGNTNSFDGDFSNGSILFSNANGVITENNSQFYWDKNNNQLALGSISANEILTLNGNLSLKDSSVPSATSGFGKLYATNSNLYFQNELDTSYNVINGNMAAPPSAAGSNTNFQFNDSGTLGGNGALTFTQGTKTLQIASNAPLDINSTNFSIADNNISFDSASGVTFTPTAGQNLNIALSGTGDFTINTNQIYLDTSASKLGLTTNNPNEVLTVNGNLSLKEVSAPSATNNYGKIYVKSSDSKVYFKNDSGTEIDLTNPSSSLAIDDLIDAITTSSSVYLGNGAGLNANGGSLGHNTAAGINALRSTSNSGVNNTALGFRALYSNSNGSNNSAIGASSLFSNTSGSNNTAAGSSSLTYNTIGNHNVALGAFSLSNNISGSQNLASGYLSLTNNVNGDANIAIGQHALWNNVSGNGNIAIGRSTLGGNQTGSFNTIIGFSSGAGDNESYNTSLGYQTISSLEHGTANLALGTGAISAMHNGSYNIALGANAGKRNTLVDTSNGTYIGYNAGSNDVGDNNIFIGHNTGNGYTSGSTNILVGYNNTNLPNSSASNQLDIADTIYGDLANHNIGIGTSSIDTKLEVNGNAMVNTLLNKAVYNNSSGANVTVNWNNGNKQKITLTQNGTFAFTAPSSGVGSFTLMLIQDGTGSRKVTWPASVKWAGGFAPTLSTAPGYIDLVSCVYTGSNYLCQTGLDFR